VALAGPLFALGARHDEDWRIRLSRAATFQSLSLLAICAYFAVMAVLATALKSAGGDWLKAMSVAILASHGGCVDGSASKPARSKLGQGEDRQAPVRAPLRLSHGMASLYRHAWSIRIRGASRSANA
jgi:hypothetical protein